MWFTFPSEKRDKDASFSGPSKQNNFHLRFDIIPQWLLAVGGLTAEEEGQLNDQAAISEGWNQRCVVKSHDDKARRRGGGGYYTQWSGTAQMKCIWL